MPVNGVATTQDLMLQEQSLLEIIAGLNDRIEVLETVPPVVPPVTGRTLLGQSDITFLGSFDVNGNVHDGLAWGMGFSHRYVGNQLRFMTTAYGSGNQMLVEFAPVAFGSTVQTATKVWPGIALTPTLGPGARYQIWFDEVKQRLIKTEWIDYPGNDAEYLEKRSISSRTLNADGSFSNKRGVFGTDGLGGRAATGGMRRVPAWFRAAYGVDEYCIGWGGYTSVMARTLMPSMGLFVATIPDPTTLADNQSFPASQIKILADHRSGAGAAQDWYPSGQPTTFDRGVRNPDVINEFDSNRWWKSPAPDALGRWVWGDSNHGCGEWIDNDAGTRNRHGFLTVGTFYSGRAWYEGSSLHCERRTAEIQVFNPLHLAEVKAGTRQPWNVKPVSRLDITSIMKAGCDALRGRDGNGPEGAASASTFDATTNTLYIYTSWATNSQPYNSRVYAFRVG